MSGDANLSPRLCKRPRMLDGQTHKRELQTLGLVWIPVLQIEVDEKKMPSSLRVFKVARLTHALGVCSAETIVTAWSVFTSNLRAHLTDHHLRVCRGSLTKRAGA